MPITAQGSGDIERKSPAVMSSKIIISFYFYFGWVSFCVVFFFSFFFSFLPEYAQEGLRQVLYEY